jgi:hypothetical protein
MSRLSLFAVALAAAGVSCKGASPQPTMPGMPDSDGASTLWPRADGGGPDRICGETHPLTFTRRDADVLLLFDRSESMITEFAGSSSRYAVVSDLLGQMVDVYQDKLRFGFQQFPEVAPCPAGYAPGCCAGPPSVGIALGNAPAVRAALTAAAPPGGSTPTALAFHRARAYFAGLDDGITDRYILLATDGRPSCNAAGRLAEADVVDADGNRIAGACFDALTEVDALVATGVKVIVLGVGSALQDDPGGLPGCLEEIARRGLGPGLAVPEERPWFFSGTDPDRLEVALQQIFGGTIRPSCLLELDEKPADTTQVAVFLDGHEVPRNRNYGWDYDADSADAPTRIRFFGDYCRRIDRFQVSAIEVRYGCPPCMADAGVCE